MPAVDSKTVSVARSVLTTPLAGKIPSPTQARDRDVSSWGPCQHRTFKQAQTTQQTHVQSITKLFGTKIDKSNSGEVCIQDTLPCPLAFDSWPPASHQQIAHGLGHPPEPALTEPPLPGFRVASEPRRKPAGMFLRIRSDICAFF